MGQQVKSKSNSLDEAFRANERYLWGICYRMTGTANDAEDLVQETFTRAIERPPERTDLDWRPWLVRVAMNLSRDLLRKRKVRGYTGPWLPSPVELSANDATPPGMEQPSPDTRYDLLESVSFAFLLALEALNAKQRAVLVLRDVFDYSVKEAAKALDMSEANIKTTLHRARKAMGSYDEARRAPVADERERLMDVMQKFVMALTAQDVEAVEALLREDALILADGGGVYNAALKPIRGRRKAAHAYLSLARKFGAPVSLRVADVNGMPAMIMQYQTRKERDPPAGVIRVDLDDAGKIAAIHSVLAPDKLTAISFD
jgi:RNA polymerase sigma-70 factor (ECF subfamily)